MFAWINRQGVRSEKGFELQFTGRFEAEYRESGKKVTLDIESGISAGIPCIILDPGAFNKWDDGESIPPPTQVEKFRNVESALNFQGLKMLVQAGQ